MTEPAQRRSTGGCLCGAVSYVISQSLRTCGSPPIRSGGTRSPICAGWRGERKTGHRARDAADLRAVCCSRRPDPRRHSPARARRRSNAQRMTRRPLAPAARPRPNGQSRPSRRDALLHAIAQLGIEVGDVRSAALLRLVFATDPVTAAGHGFPGLTCWRAAARRDRRCPGRDECRGLRPPSGRRPSPTRVGPVPSLARLEIGQSGL
jgi:hypothetical protein